MELFQKRVSILTGHYGSGKSTIALNIAFALAYSGAKTCLVDMDTVNPYFRSADLGWSLDKAGVRLIAPVFARTNLDIPSLPGEVSTAFDDRSYHAVLDVGGDDAGAAALGRYSAVIRAEGDFEHYYVINACRALTQTAEEAAMIMREVEQACRVPVTAIINNTNLSLETSEKVVLDSIPFGLEVSRLTGLPVAFVSAEKTIAQGLAGKGFRVFPMELYIRMPWQN